MTRYVTGGGNPQGYSSVVGPDAPWDFRMRNHIAHELIHHWIGVGLWIKDERKVSGYWFTEGFTTHYARAVPLRIGLITPAEFLDDLNRDAASYYGSPHRAASNATIEVAMDKVVDRLIGLVPYWKGAFYAAELDSAIRAASKGARSLDTVMNELRRRAKEAPRNAAGYAELPESVVRELVVAELGEAGAARFDAVVRSGALAAPPGDAYGPCFDRRPKRYPELELGFDTAASDREPRSVRGLVPGSAAARAGLAEGDAIVTMARPPTDPAKEMTLTIKKRDGQSKEVRYRPAHATKTVEGFEWLRVPGVPDERCASRP
jgi:predicted metalloprotease with PDZ domain